MTSLSPVAHAPADLEKLLELVAQAEALDRTAFTEESLTTLDLALRRAAIVQSASNPSQEAVDGASAQLDAAIQALESTGEVPPSTVAPVLMTVSDGDPIVLPTTVTVTAFNGSVTEERVNWDDVLDWIYGPGTYEVSGLTETGLAAGAVITVTERQWIVNHSFEDDDLSAWHIEGMEVANEDPSDGDRALKIWGQEDRNVSVWQQIDGLPAGTYSVSVTSQGELVEGAYLEIFVSEPGEENPEGTALEFNGWQEFSTVTSPSLLVGPEGSVVIGVRGYLDGNGSWGTVDDFQLHIVREAGDATYLQQQIDAAAALDRSLYTDESLANLDLALIRANVVLGATFPTQASLDDAADAIAQAIANLEQVPGEGENGGGGEGENGGESEGGGETDKPGGETDKPGTDEKPSTDEKPGGEDGTLPATGASQVTLLGGVGITLVLTGATALYLRRRSI